jgi:hypothetical protein
MSPVSMFPSFVSGLDPNSKRKLRKRRTWQTIKYGNCTSHFFTQGWWGPTASSYSLLGSSTNTQRGHTEIIEILGFNTKTLIWNRNALPSLSLSRGHWVTVLERGGNGLWKVYSAAVAFTGRDSRAGSSSTVKVEPLPGWEAMANSPRWRLRMCLTIANPRPVPPFSRLDATSIR